MQDAEDMCAEDGGHLLWFENELEYVWVTSIIAGVNGRRGWHRYYLGLYNFTYGLAIHLRLICFVDLNKNFVVSS